MDRRFFERMFCLICTSKKENHLSAGRFHYWLPKVLVTKHTPWFTAPCDMLFFFYFLFERIANKTSNIINILKSQYPNGIR